MNPSAAVGDEVPSGAMTTFSRTDLAARFTLYPPVADEVLAAEEARYGGPLPAQYRELVRVTDGLYSQGNLTILGVDGLVARNADYEVPGYLPGYLMVGDDGGTAILIRIADGSVHEVDMGVMDEESMRSSADSLEHLLALGTTLIERDD